MTIAASTRPIRSQLVAGGGATGAVLNVAGRRKMKILGQALLSHAGHAGIMSRNGPFDCLSGLAASLARRRR
ncbi:MAG: hypothetical protein HXY20_07780 [Acidobacteria bacterium]|nr:hypothetical protein [Acidobacteriota bacterium]